MYTTFKYNLGNERKLQRKGNNKAKTIKKKGEEKIYRNRSYKLKVADKEFG